MADSLLTCQQVTCGYPARTVLSEVNFSLEAGVVTALLGPNGSGKSTLLKTLAKTLPPLAGEVRVLSDDIEKLGFQELGRRVAFVPQEEHTQFKFTVRQVVTMGRLPHSGGFFDTQEDHDVATEAMRSADCLDLQDRPLMELSGGEAQRALIARALAQRAPILLLDEPTSHLDVGHQVALVQLLRNLANEGHAVLAAIHDLNLASALADRALLLGHGSIGADRSCEEVLADPLLEEVYQVKFYRLRDEKGRLRVFPEPASA